MKKLILIAATCLMVAAVAFAQTPPQHAEQTIPHSPAAATAPQHTQAPIAHTQSAFPGAGAWFMAANLTAEQQKQAVPHTQVRPQGPMAHATDQGAEQFPFLFKHMGVSELKTLGISDEQIQQINQVYQNNRDRLNQLNAEVRQRENDLRFLLDGAQVDGAQAEQAVDALVEARGRLSKATTMMMLQMRQLMTAEQWFKLSELQQRLPNPGLRSHAATLPQRLPPGVYRAGQEGVSAPQLTSKVEPAYSEKARAEKIEGTVIVYTIIGADGVPRDIRIARTLGPELDQKAIEAVSQWKFQPGMKNGQPVPVAATIEITFRLR